MENSKRAEKFKLGGKRSISDDGLNFEGTLPNNGKTMLWIYNIVLPYGL